MATTKRPAEKPPQNTEFKFVAYELTAPELRELKAWKPTIEELDDIVSKLTDEGYKFTLKFDEYNDCEQCTMMQAYKNGPNWNLGLVGRGSTPLKALKQALWKHKSCDANWPIPDHTSRRQKEFDD